MRTSTSFATLVAFMAITGSATPIGGAGSSDRVLVRACGHEYARGLVPESHLNSVKDVTTPVGGVAKNGGGTNLAIPDTGKPLSDMNHIVDGLPSVHACVDVNDHDEKPNEQPQHQEPPKQEPPKDQPAPQNPESSQTESQPPKNDPQPQSSETHDDDSGATVLANTPDPEKTENGIEDVHDQVVNETKGAVQEVPSKVQDEISAVQENIDRPEAQLDVVAGANISVNKSQQLGHLAGKRDDKELLNVEVTKSSPTLTVRRFFNALGLLA